MREMKLDSTLKTQELALALTEKLEDFGVKGEVSALRPGPVITTLSLHPQEVSKYRRFLL